jgi:methylase of polypeptide subunit release factors
LEEILFKIYVELPRQRPGSLQSIRQAAQLLKNVPVNPQILDLGCGSGIQTIEQQSFLKQ